MKILSFSTCYPNPREPAAGTFVHFRLQHMAACADIRVLAPVSPIRYSNLPKVWVGRSEIPDSRRDGNLLIYHPRYVYLPIAGAFNAFGLFLQLLKTTRKIRRAFDFQVIDCHFGVPDGVTAALLSIAFRRPFTVTLRGSEVEHAEYRLRRITLGWALRRAQRVIAVSEKLKQFAISLGVSPTRAVTIPNGVDAQMFFPRDKDASRRKFGIDRGPKIILSVGVLMELKGHHRIVQALRSLLDQGLDANLWIAGGAARARTFEPEIRRVIADLGLAEKVKFLGQVSHLDMPELMCAADVLCLASSREGCPNVVLEALSSGVPVVATRVGSVPELIPAAHYGIIVPPNDVPALASALSQALCQQWDGRVIANWGRSNSWEHVAEQAIDQIRAAIAERSQTQELSLKLVGRE